jgi:hypothetical protein
MNDSALELILYYFKNGVTVTQLPIISKAVTNKFSYMLKFSDIKNREFVHD